MRAPAHTYGEEGTFVIHVTITDTDPGPNVPHIEALFGGSPFVLTSETDGASVSRSTGTAVYFPIVGDVQVVYGDLDFAHASGWGSFITAYQKA